MPDYRRPRRGTLSTGVVRRRQTLWLAIPPLNLIQVAEGGVLAFVLNAAALQLRPFTIVRTLMWFHMRSDQAAASEFQMGAFGFSVVSDQAVAIGVTAVPTPIIDIGSDLFFAYQGLAGAGADVVSGQSGFGFRMDSRAMRKVSEGHDIAGVLELSATGNGIDVLLAGRMLIKVH